MTRKATGQQRDTRFYNLFLWGYGTSFVRACDELSEEKSTAEGEYFTTLALKGLGLATFDDDAIMGGAYYRTEKFLPFYEWFRETPVYKAIKEIVVRTDAETERLASGLERR